MEGGAKRGQERREMDVRGENRGRGRCKGRTGEGRRRKRGEEENKWR